MINKTGMTELLAQMQAMKVQAQEGSSQIQSTSKGSSFSELLSASINAVSETQMQAGGLAQSFEKGEKGVDLAEVMVAIQKANVSFQTMVQVRNKLIEAYQDIKNMPI